MTGIKLSVLMPYEKFVQSVLGKSIHGRKRIKGVFREVDTGKIVKGDNFVCIVTGKNSAEESYKDAIKYFNHTRQKKERKREYVSVEWESENLKEDEVVLNE